jgi:hypothetical protein
MHNCLLVDPLPHQVLDAYARLRRDKDLHAHLYQNAIGTFEGVTWEDQLEQSYRWIAETCANEGGGPRDHLADGARAGVSHRHAA